jgi:glucose-6-phosphate isomerase
VSLSSQHIRAGRLERAFRRERHRLTAENAIAKLWAKQPDLWTSEPAHARVITNRLGWIEVLDLMRRELPRLAAFAREVRDAELSTIVLLGMGGSSLAPEVFSLTFPAPGSAARFFVLDSTDPGAVLEVEKSLDLRSSLFIVASKSGKTVETISQFEYFRQRLADGGVREPGQHFIAITDPGSHLEQLASQHRFRQSFLNPADIGGRYSALSFFGLLPAALWDVDLAGVLDSAVEMRAACAPGSPAESNPALALGALLGAGAVEGLDKLVLLSTPALLPLGNWIEQLVAESTGKQGKGIVPVAGGAFPTPETLADGCVVVALRLQGESSEPLDRMLRAIEPRAVPIVEIQLARPADLGAEFFKWEAATALAGAVLRIDPFDEPNVQESKDYTARILEQFQATGRMPGAAPQFSDSGIEVYPAAASTGSATRLADVLRAFFASRKPGDYLGVLAFVERNPANAVLLDALRDLLGARLPLPVLLGYGPRYLHSIGQLYKGGPPTGMFMVLTATKERDVAIPGAKFTFGQLQLAQALGDMDSLAKRNKLALRLHLTQGAAAGLAELCRAAEQALASVQPATG